MVTVVARWKVKPNKTEQVLKLAGPLIEYSRKENGCTCYDLYLKQDTTDEILIFETYKSMADFETHKKAPYFKEIALDQIVPLLAERELSVFE